MFPLYGIENEMANRRASRFTTEKMPIDRRDRQMAENSTKLRTFRKGESMSIAESLKHQQTPMKSFNQQRSNSTDSLLKSTCKKSSRPCRDKSTKATKGHTPRKISNGGDRFIPSRSTSQITLGQYLMYQSNKDDDDVFLSPSKQHYQKVMSENLNGDILSSQILKFDQKPSDNCCKSNLKILYSSSKVQSSTTKSMRHIPQSPERILDAPDMLDDYYLNLLDWSSQNMLAVSLGSTVYLWNATTSDIQVLLELEEPTYVASVAWTADGNHLAVGTSGNEVQLWDVMRQKKLRYMRGHEARVGSLSWNENILSSGSKSGFIHHHDVRVSNHLVENWQAHQQEVCGLKWSTDGRYLASGGNDNVLNIYSSLHGYNYTSKVPLYSFTDHTAAVKALAWCPWQPNLLASGGGTADQQIRFWNCNMGVMVNSVNTRSQVCSILWSKEYNEFVSSHGFEHNQLIIWSYPKLERITELTGHTSRVLHLGMSPDGSVVVSAAADETLRLWKCFAVDPKKKKKSERSSRYNSTMNALQCLR